jgi:hypothetical protein
MWCRDYEHVLVVLLFKYRRMGLFITSDIVLHSSQDEELVLEDWRTEVVVAGFICQEQ